MKFEKKLWNNTSYDVVIIKIWTLLWEYLRFASVEFYMIRCSIYALFKITHVAWSVETDVLAFDFVPLYAKILITQLWHISTNFLKQSKTSLQKHNTHTLCFS